MLNPMDISDRRFEKAARGYRCEEVEAFLKDVALAYASLLKDNQECENKIIKLVDKINEYRADEDAIKSALLGAQKQGNLIINEAEASARKIISDATSQSEKMAEATKLQYQDELEKLKSLKLDVSDFKAQLTELFNRQLRLIMEIPEVDEEELEETALEYNELSLESEESDESMNVFVTDELAAASEEIPLSPYSAEAYFGKSFSDSSSFSAAVSTDATNSVSSFGDLKFGNNNIK